MTKPRPSKSERARTTRAAPSTMLWIPGGSFTMGSDRHYPEERPAHRVHVDGFFMDETLVTNEQFSAFVEATGYITLAEIAPSRSDYPDALPQMLKAGSLVFSPPDDRVRLDDPRQWWTFCFGANWRRPYGRGSSIRGLGRHPVVHIAYRDALAYAIWADKELPTEAEWEFAARGGLEGAEFAWGDEFQPDGRHLANTWQGEFPFHNSGADGFIRTSPVGSFPPNGYGLYDMIGNVWEWTEDWWSSQHRVNLARPCCTPRNPRGGDVDGSYAAVAAGLALPQKVLKGGSHLCAPSYCQRYRPAARNAEAIDTSTSHLGFRCIRRVSTDLS